MPERSGQQQSFVDFAGTRLQAQPGGAAVEQLVSAHANVRGLRANAHPNPETGGWRLAAGGWRDSLDFDRLDAPQPVGLRLQLALAGNLLSEIGAHALAPE